MTVLPEQLAEVLLQRHREAQAEHRARAAKLRERISQLAQAARARGELQRCWLIGSVTTNTFGAGSDVDVVVQGLTEEGHYYSELLQLGVEVDLLEFESLPATFQERVLTEGLVLA